MLILFCFTTLTFGAIAQAEAPQFGQVKFLLGEAKADRRKLAVGDKVFLGDIVATEKNSVIRIKLADGSGAFQLGPTSSAKLSLGDKTITTIDLLEGLLLSSLKPSEKPGEKIRYKVRTKTVAMGVRGTTFFARVDSDKRTFQCICEGRVESNWKNGKESFVSKHHENRHFFDGKSSVPASMDLPTNHTDEEVAELKKLLD